ncbi:MAG: hypothetical protein ACKOC8_00510 [Pirellulales bacterium]
MTSLPLWLIPVRPRFRPARWPVAAACLVVAATALVATAEETQLGIALVPHDAAFVSSSLRLRDQYDRLMKSNAVAAIKALPAVKRLLESADEQRSAPGSPLSMLDTLMQLPENEDAAALLADMVSTDTLVYGEPSCVSFAKLLRLVAASQRQASFGGVDLVADAEAVEDEGDSAGDDDNDGDDGGAAATAREQARATLEVLAANLDLIVVPDVVWLFKTTKPEIGTDQLKRLEVLGTLMLQSDPEMAKSLTRRKVAGGDLLTFTLDGDRVPWDDFGREMEEVAGDKQQLAKVLKRLRTLDLVVAIGLVGDWVVLSVGDSLDHLDKLALPGSDRKGLLTVPAFAPLLEHLDKQLTGISYMSEALAETFASSRSDVESLAGLVDDADDGALSAKAREDIRGLVKRAADEYEKRLPDVGPWTAFSMLTDRGYEGYVWDWTRNRQFDGSKRLDLLEHAGGAPLAVAVSRLKSDPAALDAVIDLAGRAWKLFQEHGLARLDEDERDAFDAFDEHITPLGPRLASIVTTKLAPAIGDGQVGLVLDAKSRTKKPAAGLPASTQQLPLVEPAVVLPLANPKLFREGLSDLFALGDELTAAIRTIDAASVPAGYRIPEPEKLKIDGGTVWAWPLDKSGLDAQVRPAIGVGEQAAVFSLAPAQAGRLLVESKLETGGQLATFAEPLASAAALDVAGLIDVLEPWVVYLTRYGCVQERDGMVDAGTELSADDENDQAKEVLAHVKVVLEAAKSLRAMVAETAVRDDALVTHWRNVIRDMPAKAARK